MTEQDFRILMIQNQGEVGKLEECYESLKEITPKEAKKREKRGIIPDFFSELTGLSTNKRLDEAIGKFTGMETEIKIVNLRSKQYAVESGIIRDKVQELIYAVTVQKIGLAQIKREYTEFQTRQNAVNSLNSLSKLVTAQTLKCEGILRDVLTGSPTQNSVSIWIENTEAYVYPSRRGREWSS